MGENQIRDSHGLNPLERRNSDPFARLAACPHGTAHPYRTVDSKAMMEVTTLLLLPI